LSGSGFEFLPTMPYTTGCRSAPHTTKRSCGLHQLPDRRTFDRRFKIIPVQNIILLCGSEVSKRRIGRKGRMFDRIKESLGCHTSQYGGSIT